MSPIMWVEKNIVTPFCRKAEKQLEKLSRNGIETACGLVENEQLGSVAKGRGKTEFHLHALRKLDGLFVFVNSEIGRKAVKKPAVPVVVKTST